MNHAPLQVYIGYDSREPIAFSVLAHSILTRASGPVSITPLVQPMLRRAGIYTRERGPTESTEFSMTRFLVPYLSGYLGYSVFLDCDILCRTDLVADVDALVTKAYWRARYEHRPTPALLCCQHDYTPSEATKFLGQPQSVYPRKNWSSVMVFENARCKALTPEYVNHATGLQLHRFAWLEDGEIGSLPLEYNWLVGEYAFNAEAKLVHWSSGGPWFEEYRQADYADEWFAARDAAMGTTEAGLGAALR